MNNTKNQTTKLTQHQQHPQHQDQQRQKSRQEQEPKKQAHDPSALFDAGEHQDHEQEHPETRLTR
jgi:hypothetical protein